jgi:hypothetical protein
MNSTNIQWIAKGNTGCTFATLFAKDPESIGWKFYDHTEWMIRRKFGVLEGNIISIIFPSTWEIGDVTVWAYKLGFFTEYTSDETVGLRLNCEEGVSWVQYLGPDSHVKTRQSPNPMLIYCQKLNTSFYFKVGFKGILHLAHAWNNKLKEVVADRLWNRSFKQVEKKIGHKPTIKEAAKTTFLESKYEQ